MPRNLLTAPLFCPPATAKQYLPASKQVSEEAPLQQNCRQAQEDWAHAALGTPLYYHLWDKQQAVLDNTDTFTEAEQNLINLLQPLLAWASFDNYLIYAQNRVREAGPKRLTGQNTETSDEVGLMRLEASLNTRKYWDNLWDYLRCNTATYPTWRPKVAQRHAFANGMFVV